MANQGTVYIAQHLKIFRDPVTLTSTRSHVIYKGSSVVRDDLTGSHLWDLQESLATNKQHVPFKGSTTPVFSGFNPIASENPEQPTLNRLMYWS